MGAVVFGVTYGVAELRSQLGILYGDGLVDRRMAGDIRGVVRQRPQREREFVRILALREQLSHEVSAADVMHQIAEFHAAKREVTKVLNDGAAISVAVRLLDLVFRE